MSAVETKLHPAIEAVSAEEEEWRAIGFREVDPCAIYDVGRVARLGYYFRKLEGTSEPEDIAELDAIEPLEVSPHNALAFRDCFDIHWRKRPEIAEGLGKLWVADFFRETGEGGLEGDRTLDVGNYSNQECKVMVGADGAVTVRLDRDTIYTEDEMPVEWHEYDMPRGTYLAHHKLKLEGITPQRGGLIRKDLVNSYQVQYQVNLWIARLLNVVAPES
jgi:hypothetical protein